MLALPGIYYRRRPWNRPPSCETDLFCMSHSQTTAVHPQDPDKELKCAVYPEAGYNQSPIIC